MFMRAIGYNGKCLFNTFIATSNSYGSLHPSRNM